MKSESAQPCATYLLSRSKNQEDMGLIANNDDVHMFCVLMLHCQCTAVGVAQLAKVTRSLQQPARSDGSCLSLESTGRKPQSLTIGAWQGPVMPSSFQISSSAVHNRVARLENVSLALQVV
jgi:hypothetical protein